MRACLLVLVLLPVCGWGAGSRQVASAERWTEHDTAQTVLDHAGRGLLHAAPLASSGDLPLNVSHVMDSVVKVYTQTSRPNYSNPWQRQRQAASYSSGLLAEGPRGERWVLSNAHAVENYSQVRLKRRDSATKYLAKVLAIGQECDIAILTVDAPEFWEGADFVEWGGLPELRDSVFAVGFPIGGDMVSVTSGVVSRVEVTEYSFTATQLLAVQIDAAINPGNSGGPAFNEQGECVGIAFQAIENAQNIGYIIPTPVVFHFLDDFANNGTYTGFPVMGVDWQRMDSAALRAAYKMPQEATGVLLTRVHPVSPAAGLLRPGDVLMRFSGVEVASDGTVPFRAGERIVFGHLVSQRFSGDEVEVEVLRDGEQHTFSIKLMRPNLLIPRHLNNSDPSYAVVAGLVLNVVTVPYLKSEYGETDYLKDSPPPLLEKLVYGYKESPDEQVVALQLILAGAATIGYEQETFTNFQVQRFNGRPVRNLLQLVQSVINCTDPYMRFDVGPQENTVILETAGVANATTQTLQQYAIPRALSRDVLQSLGLPAGEAGGNSNACSVMDGAVGGSSGGSPGVAKGAGPGGSNGATKAGPGNSSVAAAGAP